MIRIHSTGLLFHLFSRVGQTDLKTFFSRPEYLSYPGCITSRASILSFFFFFLYLSHPGCITSRASILYLSHPDCITSRASILSLFFVFCIFHIPTALLAGPRYFFFCIFHIPTALLAGPRYNFTMAVARGTSAPKPRTNHTIRPATQTRTPHSARHTHSTPPLNGHPSGARARARAQT